ncbi:MAG TPA: NUDIX domain-containing protein [Pseudomonadales bacterium]|nr:NUDIX domain-containing protein [Pseudomonadales bacterium]
MRDTFPVLVHTLLLRRDAVLLLRRARTGYLDGWYALPGGHLERGESVVACAIRECAEEAGVVLDAARIEPVAALPYRSDGQQGVDFIMACRDFVGEPRLAEPERFDAIGFHATAALPERTVPYVARVLEMQRRGEWFGEVVD